MMQDWSSGGGSRVYRCLVRHDSPASPTSVSNRQLPKLYVPGRLIHNLGDNVTVSEGSSMPRKVVCPRNCGGCKSLH